MSRSLHDDNQSPVSFPVNIARLPQKGMPVRIVANEKQRADLAEAHGLEDVSSFIADLNIVAWKRHGVRVSGRVRAQITQTCIVTLEPIQASIDADVEALFLPEDSKLGRLGFDAGGEILIDAEGEDAPETFSGDYIDAGAVSEEFFGLAIDPYPRKEGAELSTGTAKDDDKPAEDWKAKLSGLASRK